MRVTASKVHLLQYCQAWAQPGAEWDQRERGPEAERGDRFHVAIDAYVVDGIVRPVAEDIAAEYVLAIKWLQAWRDAGADIKTEVAFAYDPTTDTARILEGVKGRAYPDTQEVCGTADLVIESGGSLYVPDWKSGNSSESGPQLRTLGLMAARALRYDAVTVMALDVGVAEEGGPVLLRELERQTLDSFDLAAIAGEIADGLAKVAGSSPAPGSHCYELFCPAKMSCPLSKAGLAEVFDVIPAEALTQPRAYRLTDPITTADHAAWAIDVIRLMTAKLKDIKGSIRAKVPDEGWALDDGRVLKELTRTMPRFDQHKAVALCRQLGATEAQIRALTVPREEPNGLRVVGGTTKPRTKRSKAA